MEAKKIRLLLVEDDPVDQLAFKRMEQANEAFDECHFASSYKEALVCIGEHQYDIIVSDFFLGDGTGLDLLQKVQSTPFILITGTGNVEFAVKAMRNGAFDYLIKDPQRNYLKILPYTIEKAFKQREKDFEIQKLSLAASKSNNAVIITDSEGRIEWINEGFTLLTGYTSKEVIGTHGEILRKGQQTGISPTSDFFNQLREGLNTISYETQNYTKDGKAYWALTTLTAIRNLHKVVESIIAIDSDITERKAAEEAILEAKRFAEEAKQIEEEFLANTSHEIRTPMNGILGLTDILLKTTLEDKQREYLSDIRSSANKLLYIINDILDFSKIRAGQITFENIPFSVQEVGNDIVKSLSQKAIEKNVNLFLNQTPARKFLGDPVRLHQVLLNLCDNAIKFTPEQGFVKLSIEETNVGEDQSAILFTVTDTGIGIPADKQQHIFESFKQANTDTTRKYGGTGLGLSISQKLVHALGSEIKLESQADKGSTFSFELILKHAPISETKAVIEKKQLFFSSPINILAAEDNKISQKVLSEILTGMGASLTVVNNGREVIEELQRNQDYQLILVDLRMPEISGIEAARKIRNEFSSPVKDLPIIAISASALVTEKQEGLEAGINDYILKPYTEKVLYEKIIITMGQPTNRSSHSPSPQAYSGIHIDLSELFQFQRSGSSFINEIITIFITDTPKDLAHMQVLLSEKNHEGIEQIAHRLAPTAGLVGSPLLMEKLRALETAARAKTDFMLLAPMLEDCQSLGKLVIEELESFKRSHLPV